MAGFRLRNAEWILVAFFAYIALMVPFFRDRPHMSYRPISTLLAVLMLLITLAALEQTRFSKLVSMIRDWVPMALTLLAFRGMEVFVPAQYNTAYESAWIHWDRVMLHRWGLKKALESLGPVIPAYLELCYLLVYGLGSFCIGVLWAKKRRASVDRFYVILLTGTLLAYAMFPYFPSRPPRLVFPAVGFPVAQNLLRTLNLSLLRNATIHCSVFPSAHVSSAFAAAWGMFLVMPQEKAIKWGVFIYAVSVAIATVYGRYHYATDAIAGFAVSLLAATVCLFLHYRDKEVSP